LPIYARDILHTGPSGLGLLRSAPAVGAGTVPAVVCGGIATCVVVLLWAWWFPALRQIDRLDDMVET
jgi:hypothetical protein